MQEIAEICTELSQKAAQESSAQNQRVAALMMASVAVLLVVIILLELLDAKRQNTKLEQMLKIRSGKLSRRCRSWKKEI